jgi:hypothetical protein
MDATAAMIQHCKQVKRLGPLSQSATEGVDADGPRLHFHARRDGVVDAIALREVVP